MPIRRVNLTVRLIDSLRGNGDHQWIYDLNVDRLMAHVAPDGGKDFRLHATLPGRTSQTRMLLCPIETPLTDARDIARDWLAQLKRGIDPRPIAEALRRQAKAKSIQTIGPLLEQYRDRHLKTLRTEVRAWRNIQRWLMPRWRDMPITDLKRRDIIDLVEEIADRGTIHMAYSILQAVSHFCDWCVQRDIIEVSPAIHIKPGLILPPVKARDRVLSREEIVANWRGACRLPTPWMQIIHTAWLTGQRRSEVIGMRWSELDLVQRIWTIPAARYKTGVDHQLPLSEPVIAILQSMHRQPHGDHVFSASAGLRPIAGFSRVKTKLDGYMAEELGVESIEPDWRLHDIRRTVRSELSALRTPDNVSEMVLGHSRKGIQRVYDRHRYLPEMREALDAWAVRLDGFVNPKNNVIPLFSA